MEKLYYHTIDWKNRNIDYASIKLAQVASFAKFYNNCWWNVLHVRQNCNYEIEKSILQRDDQ